MMELVYTALITTVGGIIGLILWQRYSLVNWGVKMDYKQLQYDHKERIEKLRNKKSLERLKLKQEKGSSNPLENLDLDKIGDLITGVQDLNDSSGEGGILDLVKPLLDGYLNKGKESDQKIIDVGPDDLDEEKPTGY